jgi:predicted aminopeptidase
MIKLAIASLLIMTLTACVGLDYYLHSATGHLQVISKRQSISELLEQQTTPAELQQQLVQIENIRDFASKTLKLPENDSYRSYVKLDRPYVVWNVVATPEFSLEPLQWCFPIVGCVTYRGYFDHKKAWQFERSLDKDSFDSIIVGVPAYSTLNWFDDPVLSTFSDWPTVSVAKLIFHELAHQKLYVPDDTVFNESFATAVEELGIEIWLQQQNDPSMTRKYRQQQKRQAEFQKLLATTRSRLENLYAGQLPENQKRQQKAAIFSAMRKDYQLLRQGWHDYPGYDAWFNQLNNARFASSNSYHRWVPAFKMAMQQEDLDLEKFFWRCQSIAKLSEPTRHQLLDRLNREYHAMAPKTAIQ